MADASYQPLVYRKQGGSELVIASGGTLTLETGATLSSTGFVASNNVARTVTAYTTAGAISVPGISSIGTSTVGARAYTLAPPTATYKGISKIVNCVGSTGGCTLATTGTFNGTKKKITFGANGDGVAIELVATSSANWAIIGYSTAWTTTVKCT